MPWSTSRLADLAGVSVKTVRSYHERGLLDEPVRAPNGYKQYDVLALVRVLQIRRLHELGVPLSRIPIVTDIHGHPAATLRVIDAELAATIGRLDRVRAELETLLDDDGGAIRT